MHERVHTAPRVMWRHTCRRQARHRWAGPLPIARWRTSRREWIGPCGAWGCQPFRGRRNAEPRRQLLRRRRAARRCAGRRAPHPALEQQPCREIAREGEAPSSTRPTHCPTGVQLQADALLERKPRHRSPLLERKPRHRSLRVDRGLHVDRGPGVPGNTATWASGRAKTAAWWGEMIPLQHARLKEAPC